MMWKLPGDRDRDWYSPEYLQRQGRIAASLYGGPDAVAEFDRREAAREEAKRIVAEEDAILAKARVIAAKRGLALVTLA
jgi:hypothetical protein